MSNPVPPGRLSFEENISTLLEELLLAARWERPSILLAIHKSKFGQDKSAADLEGRLTHLGHRVVHLTVDEDHSDVPHWIVATPEASRIIFFVSNIDWGGGADHKDAYRSLNIYRELFVDNHIKVILWLTSSEATSLARYAPDFWAFRHRVVEFTGQRIPRKIILPSGALLWDIQNSVDPFDTVQARISVRRELLARLPDNPEARSARIDLLYNLGHLHWILGENSASEQQLQSALELAQQIPAERSGAQPLNGLAILAYEAKDCRRAAQILNQAVQLSPDHPYLLMNQGLTASALGRHQEGINLAGKALKLGSRDPKLWAARGYLYASIGKFDESITCFTKASELAPRVSSYHSALAICYDSVQRPSETTHQIELARTSARDSELALIDIYEVALQADLSRAILLGRTAIRQEQVSVYELERDPHLALLLDSAHIEELTTGTWE